MKKIATLAAFASLGLAACGSTDDASTEAMPDTVEVPADEALAPITDAPVEDPEALPPVDPAETAPDAGTANEAADIAADVAAEAESALDAIDAIEAAAEEVSDAVDGGN